jgi:plastocyanin
VSGVPHNVAFDSAQASPEAKAQLAANMPDQLQPLSGKFMMSPGDTYTVSFGKVPPGKYYYYCLPHDMLGMHGTVTVQ